MRINIVGLYGWGNLGDEAILQAIMDSLGRENQYIVTTNLPFNLLDDYHYRVMEAEDVRTVFDERVDYDVLVFGGGDMNWGYAWQQAMIAIANDKPVMMYGVGVKRDRFYSPKLEDMYKHMLGKYAAVTVRDMESQMFLEGMGVKSVLTMCPALNLKEQSNVDYPKNMIAVCPRYENPQDNIAQADWIVDQVRDQSDSVLLVPFHPRDLEGNMRDLEVCYMIASKLKLKDAQVAHPYRFNPRYVKHVISQCSMVVSGGRYHAVAWALAHNIPFKVYPKAKQTKISRLITMNEKYGSETLKAMERKNTDIFWRIASA